MFPGVNLLMIKGHDYKHVIFNLRAKIYVILTYNHRKPAIQALYHYHQLGIDITQLLPFGTFAFSSNCH